MKSSKGRQWCKRNNSEKILIVIIVLLLCLSLALFVVFFLNSGTPDTRTSKSQLVSSVCMSQACIKAAAEVMDLIQPSVDPCENFYQFVCGNFLKRSLETNEITPLTNLENIVTNQLDNLITEPSAEPLPKPLALQKKFYKSCMNTAAYEEDNTKTLMDLIQQLGGWPVMYGTYWDGRKFDWLSSMVRCRRLGFKYDYFITVTARDVADEFLLSIRPPKKRNLGYKFRDAFVDLMADVSVELGAPKPQGKNEFIKVLSFEEQLREFVLDEEENGRDVIWSVSRLAEEFPNIPWTEFLNNITRTTPFNSSSLVHFRGQRYLRNVQQILARTPKQTLANYVAWKIVEDFQQYLKEDLRARFNSFAVSMNPLLALSDSRRQFCLKEAKSYFPSVAQVAYVKKYMGPEKRKDIKQMVEKIKKQLIEEINNSSWIDEATKIYSKFQLMELDVHVGSSDVVHNESFDKVVEMEGFDLTTDNIIKMVTKLTVKKEDNYFKIINRDAKDVTREVLETSPMMPVNALYAQEFKTLVLPAPFLQQILYNIERPHYMNFGAVGSVIGHELIHGFLTQENGSSIADLWVPETRKNFEEKVQCLMDQYENYTNHLDEFTRNATRALQENIADLTGPSLAYQAYQKWKLRHGQELTLPGLDYTPNQIFWIMSGAFKCYQPSISRKSQLGFDQMHGTPSFSVTFAAKNSPEFATDFDCPPGSNMNPAERCQIL